MELTTTLDQDLYRDGDPITLTVSSEDLPDGARLAQVHYSLFERVTDVPEDHPDFGMPHGEPIRLALDGLTATGTHRAGHGPLYVQIVVGDGRDAATYVNVPEPFIVPEVRP